MKPILAILALTVVVSLNVVAQDVRSKVGPTSGTALSNIIDPDKSIYGVQWGSSEDEFISKFGNPTGYIRLNGADTAMLYGKSHAFIFTASKLSGVRINMTVLDWKLSQAILTLTPFDGIRWQLSNGIRREMNLAEVKKIVGDRLRDDHPGRYQLYFNSDNARVEIDFSRVTNDGDRDESYKVYGIYIRQASSASSALRRAPVLASKPLEAPTLRATQPTARAQPAGKSDTNRPAFVDSARASMVLISGEDSAGQPIALGTGFVIGENLIATHTGVGASARRVHVRVAGQESQTLEVASHDSYRDATILSVIKTQTAALQAPPLLLGDSDQVVARDKVYFAVEADTRSSVSEGTIKETTEMNGKRYYFEISARIAGSSKGGGPLFNREGEVIGILAQSIEGKNRFHAIPVSFLKTLLQYRNGGTSGAGGSGVGIRAVSGDPSVDRAAGVGPDQGKGAGSGSPQPDRASPAAASVDTKPVLLNYVPVRFTEEARKNKVQGIVNMSILVGEDGGVKDARITKGLPDGLNEQALAAANQMRFKPATRNGNAVSHWLPITVEFHLR